MSCHSPKLCVTYSRVCAALPLLLLLHCKLSNEMQASKTYLSLLKKALWKKMSIFILRAEFISCLGYIQFYCVSFLRVTNEMEKCHVKATLSSSSRTAILHSGVRTDGRSKQQRCIKKREVWAVTAWWHFVWNVIMIMNIYSLSSAPRVRPCL